MADRFGPRSGAAPQKVDASGIILCASSHGRVDTTGGYLLGSPARGTLALSVREHRIDATVNLLWIDDYAFFGQLNEATSASPLGSDPMISFNPSGQSEARTPAAAMWSVAPGEPLHGFFPDAVGNTYLRSLSGQLVTWTEGSGLRVYSDR